MTRIFIEELNMKAFGRFQNKIIKLGPSFNLIYGLNESGKTTIKIPRHDQNASIVPPYVGPKAGASEMIIAAIPIYVPSLLCGTKDMTK